MSSQKRCPACQQIKPVSKFGRNRSLGDGLSFYCLACNRERDRAWYRESRRRMGKEVRDHSWIPEGFRWCPSCQQVVAHENYVRNAGTASGFGSRCLLRTAADYVERHRARQAAEAASAGAGGRPESAHRPGTPPVGSKRRPLGHRRLRMCSRGLEVLAAREADT